ncbi:MAG: hypothetical protein AB8G11_21440 [Saprospiraceae bacterium]
MRKFIAVFIFLFVGYVSVFAEKWLVIINREGQDIVVTWMDHEPFPGEGIWYVGPFDDDDRVGPPATINETSVDIETLSQENLPQSSGTISSPASANAYFAYRKGDNLNIVQMDDKTNWKAIQGYLEKNGGCSNSKFVIFFTPESKDNTLKIGKKNIAVPRATFSVSYGDIIMGGKPVGFE